MTTSVRLQPGKRTIELLAKIRELMETKGDNGHGMTGVAIDNIPRLDGDSDPADVLVVAEALRGLIFCVLAPDEREEQRHYAGG